MGLGQSLFFRETPWFSWEITINPRVNPTSCGMVYTNSYVSYWSLRLVFFIGGVVYQMILPDKNGKTWENQLVSCGVHDKLT